MGHNTNTEQVAFWRRTALSLGAVALVAVAGAMEAEDHKVAEKMRVEQEERALAEDWSWHRRHERNRAACPNQQYVSQCCADGRHDLSCIDGYITKEAK